MKEGETVVLKKLGCAGWWYVRVLGKFHSLLSRTCYFEKGSDIMSMLKDNLMS